MSISESDLYIWLESDEYRNRGTFYGKKSLENHQTKRWNIKSTIVYWRLPVVYD